MQHLKTRGKKRNGKTNKLTFHKGLRTNYFYGAGNYVSNSLTPVTFQTSAILVTRACRFLFRSRGPVALGTRMHGELWIFPIHGENLGQDIPFLGRFWVFTRETCLLFFYIPMLGICCEFFPNLFKEQYGSISQVIPYIRGLLGHVNPNIEELLGSVNPKIGELLRQEKSIN